MMRRPVLAALVFSLCAPGLASVQAEPRIAMIGLDQSPEAVAEEYVRALDDMLEELAAEGGLPAPASSAPEVSSIAASVARDTQPMTSWSTVSMGVSVAAAQFGQPGVADQPGPPTDTSEADCRARYPDASAFEFRVVRFGAATGYQCLRLVRENGARRLRGIATIDLSDRRIVTGFSFNAEGSEAGVATWFPLPESAARLLFDAQVDAVILRLTRPSER